jgi:hypothetical protein
VTDDWSLNTSGSDFHSTPRGASQRKDSRAAELMRREKAGPAAGVRHMDSAFARKQASLVCQRHHLPRFMGKSRNGRESARARLRR